MDPLILASQVATNLAGASSPEAIQYLGLGRAPRNLYEILGVNPKSETLLADIATRYRVLSKEFADVRMKPQAVAWKLDFLSSVTSSKEILLDKDTRNIYNSNYNISVNRERVATSSTQPPVRSKARKSGLSRKDYANAAGKADRQYQQAKSRAGDQFKAAFARQNVADREEETYVNPEEEKKDAAFETESTAPPSAPAGVSPFPYSERLQRIRDDFKQRIREANDEVIGLALHDAELAAEIDVYKQLMREFEDRARLYYPAAMNSMPEKWIRTDDEGNQYRVLTEVDTVTGVRWEFVVDGTTGARQRTQQLLSPAGLIREFDLKDIEAAYWTLQQLLDQRRNEIELITHEKDGEIAQLKEAASALYAAVERQTAALREERGAGEDAVRRYQEQFNQLAYRAEELRLNGDLANRRIDEQVEKIRNLELDIDTKDRQIAQQRATLRRALDDIKQAADEHVRFEEDSKAAQARLQTRIREIQGDTEQKSDQLYAELAAAAEEKKQLEREIERLRAEIEEKAGGNVAVVHEPEEKIQGGNAVADEPEETVPGGNAVVDAPEEKIQGGNAADTPEEKIPTPTPLTDDPQPLENVPTPAPVTDNPAPLEIELLEAAVVALQLKDKANRARVKSLEEELIRIKFNPPRTPGDDSRVRDLVSQLEVEKKKYNFVVQQMLDIQRSVSQLEGFITELSADNQRLDVDAKSWYDRYTATTRALEQALSGSKDAISLEDLVATPADPAVLGFQDFASAALIYTAFMLSY